ncbi:MAG: hypothetical protein WD070_04515, partial [Pirellulaceae bacterium]
MLSTKSTRYLFAIVLLLGSVADGATAQETNDPRGLSRCEIVPRAGHQVSLQIDGIEKLRWHYGDQYPRPFF